MKYNPYDPLEPALFLALISFAVITLCTLAISGLVFLITKDGILAGLSLPWIALGVTIVWLVHVARAMERERKKLNA
ncbi:hypothetical protein KAW43_03465 [Candidatus Parcubacteria bacterium]|jgi:hypothetical protein|nr:hypothetical protein [Candidatus Parcubacteria bacterium]